MEDIIYFEKLSTFQQLDLKNFVINPKDFIFCPLNDKHLLANPRYL